MPNNQPSSPTKSKGQRRARRVLVGLLGLMLLFAIILFLIPVCRWD